MKRKEKKKKKKELFFVPFLFYFVFVFLCSFLSDVLTVQFSSWFLINEFIYVDHILFFAKKKKNIQNNEKVQKLMKKWYGKRKTSSESKYFACNKRLKVDQEYQVSTPKFGIRQNLFLGFKIYLSDFGMSKNDLDLYSEHIRFAEGVVEMEIKESVSVFCFKNFEAITNSTTDQQQV
jgi:hypothetical protein